MILDDIVKNKAIELAATKKRLATAQIEKLASSQPPPLDLATALKQKYITLIAEVKKASPSKGVIRADFNPVAIARLYADNGAAAISVLTESRYFGGKIEYLRDIRQLVGSRLPLLRKDFIFDPYQIYEARAYGADALLLIVAMLTPEKLKELLWLSHRLGMKCLVEVHNETELNIALKSDAELVGINNRDLNTFQVNVLITQRLKSLIPSDRIVVSESGIKTPNDMALLKEWGVDAVLIGETLMAATDIGAKMRELA